jgi:hypothetical protein
MPKTKQPTKKDADAEAKAEIEKKCAAVMKKCAARVEYFDGTIAKHEAHIAAAREHQEKTIANAERRCTNLRLKGDPKTKKMAQLAKLRKQQEKLEKEIADL